MTSLMTALLHQAEHRPQGTAFWFGEDVWTYRRLAAEAKSLARGFAERGLRKGDRVALHMMNKPAMLVAYYACFQLGLIAAPLRTALVSAELSPLLQRLQPALYLGDVALYKNVAPVDDAVLPFAARFVVDGMVDDRRVENWQKLFDDDARDGDLRDGLAAVDVDAPAALIGTSGTTGQPKLVTHTQSTLSAIAGLLIKNRGYRSDDIGVAHMPLSQASGLMTFPAFVELGAPFVLLESFDPDVCLDTIEQYRCSVLTGFPASYAALQERQLVRPRNLQSLRLCQTAGDACPVALQTAVSATFGVPLLNFWGSTEGSGSLAPGLEPGPFCRIADGSEVRLIDDDGHDVRPGEAGELCLRGPNVFIGYWGEPEKTSEVLKDGWYHTGDLMLRGDGDEIRFMGRKKDIIIRGGTNISPVEVENALLVSHPAIQEAAVVGVPDTVLGQRVVGFVKLANGATAAIFDDILAALREQLAFYKVPERLVLVDRLPRMGSGKVDRVGLARMAL